MTEPDDDDRYATLLDAFYKRPHEAVLERTSYLAGLHRLFETFAWIVQEHGASAADAERARVAFDSTWRFLTVRGDRLAEVFNGADVARILERNRHELGEFLRARELQVDLGSINATILHDVVLPAETSLQAVARLDRLRTRMSDPESTVLRLGTIALVLGVATALWWAVRAIRIGTRENEEYREFAKRFAGQPWADRLLAHPAPREWSLSSAKWSHLTAEELRTAATALDGLLGCGRVEPRLGDRVGPGMRVLDEKYRALPFVLRCDTPSLQRAGRQLFDSHVQVASAERIALERTRDDDFTRQYLEFSPGEAAPDLLLVSSRLRELEDRHPHSVGFDKWLAALIEAAPDGALAPVVSSRGIRFIGTEMNSVTPLARPAEATVEDVVARGLRRGRHGEVLLKAWVHAKDPDTSPFA